MIDILAPVGLILLAAFLVVVVVSARKQKRSIGDIYREFARRSGYSYRDEDDGTAQQLATGFDEFARFKSPSQGTTRPEHVVTGKAAEGVFCAFSHATREYEGNARDWDVCIIETKDRLCVSGPIKCTPRRRFMGREMNGLPEVPFEHDSAFSQKFMVCAAGASAARACLDEHVRNFLVLEAGNLPFAPEIQMLDKRLAVYPAGRNEDVADSEALSKLSDFARGLARAFAG